MDLLLFYPPPLCFVFENSKNTRNELARPVMGTIFLVISRVASYFHEPKASANTAYD